MSSWTQGWGEQTKVRVAVTSRPSHSSKKTISQERLEGLFSNLAQASKSQGWLECKSRETCMESATWLAGGSVQLQAGNSVFVWRSFCYKDQFWACLQRGGNVFSTCLMQIYNYLYPHEAPPSVVWLGRISTDWNNRNCQSKVTHQVQTELFSHSFHQIRACVKCFKQISNFL